jgi:hypothetical protein
MFLICLQDDVFALLNTMMLKNVTLINIRSIEDEDIKFAACKYNRNEKEYAWTSKAPIILYLFKHFWDFDNILYIDSDIKFLSSPDPIYNEFLGYSILLSKEIFLIDNPDIWYSQYGLYNGGFMGFKRDSKAIEALLYFRKLCIEWCYNRAENGLYGDQRYLSDWTTRFADVGVIQNIGINVTAWYSHCSLIDDSCNKITINGTPIVFYHYSGLVSFNKNEFDLCNYIKLPEDLINKIYLPYLRNIQQKINYVNHFNPNFYSNLSQGINTNYIVNYFYFPDSI